MHRDLKSANVFLTQEYVSKLGDLNVSKIVKKGLGYTQTGTPYYASPEVWRDQPYDSKSDIWSLGCVLYEMCALKPPFRGENMQALFKKVLRGQYIAIPKIFSKDLSAMVKSLLQVAPSLRPSCKQILEMPSVQEREGKEGTRVLVTSNSEHLLLSTIRMPKNLHYLTAKLPVPSYDTDDNQDRGNRSEALPKVTSVSLDRDSQQPKKARVKVKRFKEDNPEELEVKHNPLR